MLYFKLRYTNINLVQINCKCAFCFSGSPREGAGAPEADDGPEGGRPPEEPDAGAEGAAQAHPPGDEGQGADVQGLHADLSHQPQRGHEPHRGEGQAQKGENHCTRVEMILQKCEL